MLNNIPDNVVGGHMFALGADQTGMPIAEHGGAEAEIAVSCQNTAAEVCDVYAYLFHQ
eukprot:gene14036-20653_t